jgi:hypothetical protein
MALSDEMVDRLDYGKLGNVERTPQGGARIPARVGRTGVLVYRSPDGGTRRELVLPEELFSEDSMSSLRDAPVTDKHPPVMIDGSNYKTYQAGHTADPRKDAKEKGLDSTLVVQDANLLTKVGNGEAVECSAGYRCRIDATPGTYEGQPYDVVQRGRVYNHVAIGPKNWGRAGNDVALRLDSCDITEDLEPTGDQAVMKVIRIDGKEYEVGSEQHLAKVEADHAAALEKAHKENETLKGRCDSLTTKVTELETKVKTLEDPKRLDSAVSQRFELVTKAVKVLGSEYKCDGKDEKTIMIEALRKDESDKSFDDKSIDYLRGRFESKTEGEVVRKDDKSIRHALGTSSAAGAPQPVAKIKEDKPEERVDADESRKGMIGTSRKQAEKPMALSKTA